MLNTTYRVPTIVTQTQSRKDTAPLPSLPARRIPLNSGVGPKSAYKNLPALPQRNTLPPDGLPPDFLPNDDQLPSSQVTNLLGKSPDKAPRAGMTQTAKTPEAFHGQGSQVTRPPTLLPRTPIPITRSSERTPHTPVQAADSSFGTPHTPVQAADTQKEKNSEDEQLVVTIAHILLQPSRPMIASEFRFAWSTEAANHNWAVLERYDLNVQHALENQRHTQMEFGSEFRSVHLLEPLAGNHPLWPRLKRWLLEGAEFPLTPISEDDRHSDLNMALIRGNHKSATTAIERVQ